MGELYDKLVAYSRSDYYGFHMPGHKRNEALLSSRIPYGIDITEIDGFDDLHHAEGLLKKAEERAALLYGAEETHFLVNGSTAGILSAILGCTEKGDKILVARNCHKSVYHAMFMNELRPIYVYPKQEEGLRINGETEAAEIEQALKENPDVKAVMLVSPTYDGVVSDLETIAKLVHTYGIPLIVDEAHGAHFGFHPYFPENGNRRGADVVIHSVHKTLPSLTQTALIHMNGTILNRERVRMYLHMLQSSSPSYVLMASIDACMELLEKRKEELFDAYVEKIDRMRKRLEGLRHLEVLRTERFDCSKFVISVGRSGMTSEELYERLLREFHLQMEMRAGTYVLAMTSIGDTQEGLCRLEEALFAIDGEIDRMPEQGEEQKEPMADALPRLEIVYTSAETERRKQGNEAFLPWEQSVGKTATEYAYVYPPGIPLIVPGEKITQEAVNVLHLYEKWNFSVEGLKRERQIGVLKNG